MTKSATLRCVDDGDEEVFLRFGRMDFPKMSAALDKVRVGKDMVLVIGRRPDSDMSFGVSVQVKSIMVVSPDED